MSVLSKLVYIPLQLLFIPAAIVGAAIVAYKQLVVSKRLGLSQTAVEVINGRWIMHIFGLREDDATAKLAGPSPTLRCQASGLPSFLCGCSTRSRASNFCTRKCRSLVRRNSATW